LAPRSMFTGSFLSSLIPSPSQRNVSMLLGRYMHPLVAQGLEGPDDAPPRVVRHDDVVDEAAFGGDEGIGEAVFVILRAPGDLFGVAEFRAVEDFRRAPGAHHCDLRARPGVVHIGADVL